MAQKYAECVLWVQRLNLIMNIIDNQHFSQNLVKRWTFFGIFMVDRGRFMVDFGRFRPFFLVRRWYKNQKMNLILIINELQCKCADFWKIFWKFPKFWRIFVPLNLRLNGNLEDYEVGIDLKEQGEDSSRCEFSPCLFFISFLNIWIKASVNDWFLIFDFCRGEADMHSFYATR